MQRWLRIFVVLVVLAAMAHGVAGTAARAADTIIMGEVTRTSYQWPLWIGIAKGMFADLGLTIDEKFFTKPPESVQALSTNATNINYTVPVDNAVVAIAKEAKIVIIAGSQEKLTYDLIAGPKHATMAALKGTTIGVSSLRSGSTVILHKMMRGNGLKYPSDYKLLELGGTPQRYAGVKTGGVSASVVAQPTSFQAEDDGLKILDTAARHIPLFAFTSIGVNIEWGKQNRDKVLRFLRGNAKALRWLEEEKNRAAAVQILVKETRVAPKYAERSYDSSVKQLKAFTPGGRINLAAHQAVIDLVMESGKLKKALPMASLIDASYIEEALKGL